MQRMCSGIQHIPWPALYSFATKYCYHEAGVATHQRALVNRLPAFERISYAGPTNGNGDGINAVPVVVSRS